MTRRFRPPLVFGTLLTLLSAGPGDLRAQLRPLDPLDWDVLGLEGHAVTVGAGIHWGQRASRAGAEGRLVEVGRFRAVWGMGRMWVEVAGTAQWLFDERSLYAEPVEGVGPAEGTRRADAGDLRVSTVVALTGPDDPAALALRFGARLPTTSELEGLDRDQTDFFALLGGLAGRGPVSVGGELGVGIYGTRAGKGRQVDVLLFSLRSTVDAGPVTALLELAGQHDTRAGPELRGNEDLGEGRLGLRVGDDRWVTVALVRGWTPASPDVGLMVELGKLF